LGQIFMLECGLCHDLYGNGNYCILWLILVDFGYVVYVICFVRVVKDVVLNTDGMVKILAILVVVELSSLVYWII